MFLFPNKRLGFNYKMIIIGQGCEMKRLQKKIKNLFYTKITSLRSIFHILIFFLSKSSQGENLGNFNVQHAAKTSTKIIGLKNKTPDLLQKNTRKTADLFYQLVYLAVHLKKELLKNRVYCRPMCGLKTRKNGVIFNMPFKIN
jgi:hypothetical protein